MTLHEQILKANPSLVVWEETPEKDHAGWIARRQDSFGASDAAVLAGISKFRSRNGLWLERVTRKQVTETAAMKKGKDMEPVIFHEWADKMGLSEYEYPVPTIALPSKHIHCTPDALVMFNGQLTGVEVKYSEDARRWKDGIPDDYLLQCEWSMEVSGLMQWFLVWQLGKNPIEWELLRMRKFEDDRHEYYLPKALAMVDPMLQAIAMRDPIDPWMGQPDALEIARAKNPIAETVEATIPEDIWTGYQSACANLSECEDVAKKYKAVRDYWQARLIDATFGAKRLIAPDGSRLVRKIVQRGAYTVAGTEYETLAKEK